MRPWLWLYRPPVLGARAQAVQVLHTAAAVARTGRSVTVCCDAADRVDSAAIDAHFGLDAPPGLRLHVLPRGRTAASVAFRARVAAWIAAHPRGVVLARSKRYARELCRAWPAAHVVLEAHEVDSLLARERGADPRPAHELEAEVLGLVRGVVCNAPGTLELLASVHRLPAAAVIPNGSALTRFVEPRPDAVGVGYVGSLHRDKDLPTLVRAASLARVSLTLAGPGDPASLGPLPPGVVVRPPVPPAQVGSVLAGFRAVAIPVSNRIFGRFLTSPLKLWDARAAGLPVVAADLPALHHAAPCGFVPATPGDDDSWARGLREVVRPAGGASWWRRLPGRSWDDRAAELIAFAEGLA